MLWLLQDEGGNISGEVVVALPDGRIQTTTYSADYDKGSVWEGLKKESNFWLKIYIKGLNMSENQIKEPKFRGVYIKVQVLHIFQAFSIQFFFLYNFLKMFGLGQLQKTY